MSEGNDRRGVAIVTGGRRGIGAAVAIALAKEGFHIAIIDTVRDESGEQTVDAIRNSAALVEFIVGDISDIESHDSLVKRIRLLGPIGCLVNNAGVNMPVRGDMLDVKPNVFDQLMNVNLRGTFFLTQAVALQMVKDSQKHLKRSIIIVSSANATMVSPEKSVYCLSKSALSMAAKLYAARLADSGIDVFEVQPGLIKTKMNEPVWDSYGRVIEAGASLVRRWGEASEVGATVAALSTGAFPFCTGMTVPVGGGLHVHRL